MPSNQTLPIALGSELAQIRRNVPIAASTHIYQGNVYVYVAGYLAVPASGNAGTGHTPVVALNEVDNSTGGAGDLTVDVMLGIQVDLPNDGTHPITQADVGVSRGYLSSSFTVSTDSGDGPPIAPTGASGIVEFNQTGQIYGRPVRVQL